MKEISHLYGIYNQMKEGKLRRELAEKEKLHQMEMERIRTLASIDNVNVLIAASGPVQAQVLAELARTRTLQGFTPQQILALSAERKPEIIEGLAEMLRALGGSEKLSEAERLLAEVKESARLSREDYQRNVQTLVEMFHKALDTVRDTAVGPGEEQA
ncbi:MAG: hypothetical protein ACE5IA_04330 [Dehalococcoidia bacterium]